MDEPLGELTKAVMQARRGLSADVRHLVSLLPDHELLLPLAKAAAPGSRDVAFHCVPGPRGEKVCPLFTERSMLAAAGQRFGWKTDAGPLQLMAMSGTHMLQFALDGAEAGGSREAVLNPFHPTALPLTPEEMRGLLSGDPRALRRHLQALPIQPGEQFITRPPQGRLPWELVEAVDRLLRAKPDFGRFNFMEVVSAERDSPSLLLTIYTKVAVDGPTYAEAVDRAITGMVPPKYSHVDIMFDGAGTKQQPRR